MKSLKHLACLERGWQLALFRTIALLAVWAASGAVSWGVVAQDAQVPGSEDNSAEWDAASAYAYSQAAIGHALPAVVLTGSDGREIALGGGRDRPLVISMIYTSCYHVCPVITQSLKQAVQSGNDLLGEDGFDVLTVGFDFQIDTPERMAAFAREQDIGAANWRLASADAGAVTELSDALGFIFFKSPKGYDHLAQTTLIGRDGRVAAQVYGASFRPPDIVEPLSNLAYGRGIAAGSDVGDLWNRIRIFCSYYDPKAGRYRLDYSLVIAIIAGVMCLASVAVIWVKEWRKRRHPDRMA